MKIFKAIHALLDFLMVTAIVQALVWWWVGSGDFFQRVVGVSFR